MYLYCFPVRSCSTIIIVNGNFQVNKFKIGEFLTIINLLVNLLLIFPTNVTIYFKGKNNSRIMLQFFNLLVL